MKNVFVVAATCAIALSACSQREPTDAELTALLRRQGAAAEAKAPLDLPAINCLRAWSGDGELGKGLSPAMTTDESKSRCRAVIDGWLAAADRNPGKFDFAHIDAPAVVRRAMALQIANAADPANRRPPPALMKPLAPKGPVASLTPGAGPDMGAQGESLKQAESRCVQVQQLAAAGNADAKLQRFATYCVATLRQMRASMERSSASGANPQVLDNLAKDAGNLTSTADKLIATAASAPAPAK